MPKRKIKLGDEVEDIVSKIKGIASGRCEYLDGTVFWIIQPPVGEDSRKPPEHYAPEGYVKWSGDGVYPNTKPPAGFHIPDMSR